MQMGLAKNNFFDELELEPQTTPQADALPRELSRLDYTF